ncbi:MULTISPECIES: porin family protein [Undibacterium]|uniref:Porin family protein n=1 Tax=Undibacterium umbellatum TaxID=2762300 RepID=A0ABR6ZE93_9BURK|nr:MULTISPECIES: porin family protein [Undibacterium]MBC3910050.1 porin family protein [Undibacterium umbellatum]MDP1977009.1 porin family protein [Undibacterium sp.]
MLNKKIIAAALAISGLFAGATASAQVYVGATVGQARWNMDCAGTSSCKTNDTSFNILGGYNLNSNWGVEASYYSLGTVKASAGGLSAELKATGIDLAGVYRAQLNTNWGVFTKLGLAYSKGEATASFGNLRGSTSENSAQVMAGVGVTYAFTPNFAARAEITTRKVDFVGSSGNITNLNVGVQAAF